MRVREEVKKGGGGLTGVTEWKIPLRATTRLIHVPSPSASPSQQGDQSGVSDKSTCVPSALFLLSLPFPSPSLHPHPPQYLIHCCRFSPLLYSFSRLPITRKHKNTSFLFFYFACVNFTYTPLPQYNTRTPVATPYTTTTNYHRLYTSN